MPAILVFFKKNAYAQAGLMTALFAFLALLYSVSIPVFEAPDESAHYLYADHLARRGQLPPLDYQHPGDEYHQPPLYYWLNSVWLKLTGLPDPAPFLQKNPLAAISDTASAGNKNAFIHVFGAEGWPWRGLPLALHLGRLLSIAMGAATVWLAYWISRAVFGSKLWLTLAATGLVAFNPQFIFISASFNNDNLVVLLATLALWLAIKLETLPILNWRYATLAGLLTGLAILTKPTGWIAGLGLAAVFLKQSLKTKITKVEKLSNLPNAYLPEPRGVEGNSGEFLQNLPKTPKLRRSKWVRYLYAVPKPLWELVVMALVTLLTAGWWIWRNQILYHDPLLRNYMLAYLNVASPVQIGLLQFWQRFLEAEISFWATFGWLNITIPEPFYTIYRVILRGAWLGLGAGGILFLLGRKKKWRTVAGRMWLPLLWLAAVGLTMWQWVVLAGGIQGRLLFPAIVPLALLTVWGWYALVSPKWIMLGPIYFAGVTLYSLFFALRPAYAPPPVLDALPASAHAANIQFERGVTLSGYNLPVAPLQSGQSAELTLYWRAEAPIERPYAVFAHAVDDKTGAIIAQSQSFAGRGLLPANQWLLPGYVADQITVSIPGLTYAPTTGKFVVGLFLPENGERLPLQNGETAATLGDFSLLPNAGPFNVNWRVSFEKDIALLGYDLPQRIFRPNDTLDLTLHWQTEQVLEKNYTIFVHLLNEGEERVAQHDSWPANGQAPTVAWQPGQPVSDSHQLMLPPDLPPGAYHLGVGLYNGETGGRIPLQTGEVLFGGDMLTLTEITVR